MSQLRNSALIAGLVFAAFVAFAFLAPATYRATALISIEPASPSAELPAPLEAARRLHEAVLDRQMLERLARERAAASVSEIQSALEIDTTDGKSFSIAYRDGDAARAQSICNQLARHAVERAPKALDKAGNSPERTLEAERQRRTQELTRFLSEHPEVVAESTSEGKSTPDTDRMTQALRAERARLERKLLSAAEVVKSDNPYVEPSEVDDAETLRKRMAEIDTALLLRQKAAAEKASPPKSTLSPEIRAEWRRLVQALADVGSAPQAQAASALKARLIRDAALPSSPIEPDRPLIMLIGALIAATLATMYYVRQRSLAAQGTLAQPAVATVLPASLTPAPPEPEPLALPSPRADVESLGQTAPLPPPQPPAASPIRPSRIATLAYGPELVPKELQANGASTAPKEPAPAARVEPLPTYKIESSVPPPPPAEPEREPATEGARAESSWEAAAFAPADPKFAAVLDAAAEAVRQSEPHTGASKAPPAAVIAEHAEVVPVVPRPSPRPSPLPPAGGPDGARRPIRNKVTQRLGSFPAPPELDELAAVATRSATPTAGYAQMSPTGYSKVSVAPPPAEPWIVTVVKAGAGWHPKPELLPESRRELCDQVYPLAVEQCFVLAVSGVPEVAEGKSRLAAELALALAESGHPRILLMEGNFHQPNVHRAMRIDMPSQMGFSQQLHARIGGGRERWTVVECQKSLHVLAEGLMRSPGLLLSKQFESCLVDLRTYYDVIVIDGPTTSLEVDCRALDSVADGLLLASPAAGSSDLERSKALFSEKRFSAVVPIG